MENYASQVKFFDPRDGIEHFGIMVKDFIICGCCGAIIPSSTVEIREKLEWVSIENEIEGI